MYAQDETFSYQGNNVNFAPTNILFGDSSPSTNSAMRLMGSRGYQPWNTSLLAGGTMRIYDVTVTPVVHQIVYAANYEWGAY